MSRKISYFNSWNGVDRYATGRDLMGVNGTSRLSQFLTLGEISPRQVWHVARQAMMQGAADAEAFIKQLVWREFGYHLMYHTPHITTGNWSEKWDHFPGKRMKIIHMSWRGNRDARAFH